jgi:hypothetical protein
MLLAIPFKISDTIETSPARKIAIRVIWGVKNVDFPCVGTLARAQHDYIQSTNQPLLMRHLIKRLHNSVGGVQN